MKNAKFNPRDLHELVGSSDMTLGEMITSFRQAKDRRLQLRALAEQECCSEEDIKAMLLANGVKPQEFPRALRKKNPPPNFRGGWTKLHPFRSRRQNRNRRTNRRRVPCWMPCGSWFAGATLWPRIWRSSTRSWKPYVLPSE